MLKEELIELVMNYEPFDGKEREMKRRVLRFLEENKDDCFVRNKLDGHMVGGGILLNKQGDEILLTHHKALGKWLQFGGHADGEIDLFEVGLRETVEESGIELGKVRWEGREIFDLDVHFIPENVKRREVAHWHYELRFLFWTAEKEYVVSEESDDLKWVKLEDLEKMWPDEGRMRMMRKLRRWRER